MRSNYMDTGSLWIKPSTHRDRNGKVVQKHGRSQEKWKEILANHQRVSHPVNPDPNCLGCREISERMKHA